MIYAAPDGDATNVHLWKIDTQTGEATTLTGGPGGYAHPAVSGDGSRLAYAHARPVWRLIATLPTWSGGEPRVEAEVGPYDGSGMSFGIGEGDVIIWNEFESYGLSEIWMTDASN